MTHSNANEPLPMQTLEAWIEAGCAAEVSVSLPGDADLAPHYASLLGQPRLLIEFPTFMDGRGFSHARKLRQLGFTGELLASGDVLPDQWQFLQRCGFDGIADPAILAQAGTLPCFSEAYQADALQPEPLFRRAPRVAGLTGPSDKPANG